MAFLNRIPAALAAVVAFVGRPSALTAQAVHAAADSTLEYGVKAAYLLNFTRYVEWPAGRIKEGAPLVLCVHGADPFGTLLERTVRGRTSQGRVIELRRTESTAEARKCHAVFLSHAQWRRRPDVLAALAQRGVLTVGEGAAFAEAGGVIGFVLENEAVRFTVNRAAGEKAELKLSSRMLALATRIYRAGSANLP